MTVLIDVMHLVPNSTPAKNPQMPYLDMDLPHAGLDELREDVLSVLQGCIRRHNEMRVFESQALPICVDWLVTLASSGMDSYAKGQDIMAGPKGRRAVAALAYSAAMCKYLFCQIF